MSIKTKVEQIAYGHATAQVLSELGQQENWYKAYKYLSECVERGDEPDDLIVWQPFEHWEWKDILEQIESEAESLLSTIKSVFALAHKGIIQSAIDCSLDSDMTQLDLIGMVELGNDIEESESAGGGYAA
ncbi:hypothetical protein HZS38_04900 [Xenorhabdus nematophila]|uniref:Uncharacterized protein n=1 Tax=Xenorhabdus nematophila (strain ATCC 19061 / DSM 3370 / CCUG 14189 / LMG 1036 / NCIMB 9965 / AN6) TaxID=406817 RepID=D3VLW8_XENNA|nr:hypothetical protein [Xenorhabdus nematophila]CEF32305.1 conserved hypothetical protein [Xenorhabdus nematophila str. Websteri]KHD28190.1 hypothetical protein LH67_12485 [Xenorhabdus nematophila]MBA0018533.1 hypothetical protein [Xenorhabdus nematophila]CBJ92920.1 conserved hypothetical protein [Xenorhabdus nematophila ATCC 19061]CEK25531.1 conserved protein of unknown function [Xenorhabdus nematophila AN6/1]